MENFKDDKLVHLWYCKKPVREYNTEKIKNMSAPVSRIKAVHGNGDKESASASEDDAGGLANETLLCPGARVMLVDNCWQDAYLNNGSLGTVLHVVYEPNTGPPTSANPHVTHGGVPTVVWCRGQHRLLRGKHVPHGVCCPRRMTRTNVPHGVYPRCITCVPRLNPHGVLDVTHGVCSPRGTPTV